MQNYLTLNSLECVEILVPKNIPPDEEIWWRAETTHRATYDSWAEFEQPNGSRVVLELIPYIARRHTPKGVWLSYYCGNEFFVLGNAIRQRAVPTVELAIRDLIARKKCHVEGCENRLKRAKQHLEAAEQWLKTENKETSK